MLFGACTKTDIKNDDLINSIPGGTISAELAKNGIDTFRLDNHVFPSFGLMFAKKNIYNDKPDEAYFFNLHVSGTIQGTTYYLEGKGRLMPDRYDYYKSHPNEPISLDSVRASIPIKKGSTTYFSTIPNPGPVRGAMFISQLGKIGDPVSVSFQFATSVFPGFSDMTGNVSTRYTIYTYY